MTEPLPDRVQARLDAALRRKQRKARARAAFEAARRAGLEARRAAKIARLAGADGHPDGDGPPEGGGGGHAAP